MLLLEYPIECRHGISSLSDFAKISAPPAAGNRHKWLNNQPFVTKMAILGRPIASGSIQLIIMSEKFRIISPSDKTSESAENYMTLSKKKDNYFCFVN